MKPLTDEQRDRAHRVLGLHKNRDEKLPMPIPIKIYREILDSESFYKARTEELEQEVRQLELDRVIAESHAPEGRNYTNAQYVDLLMKYKCVEQENERLKETLSEELSTEFIEIEEAVQCYPALRERVDRLEQQLKQAVEVIEDYLSENVAYWSTDIKARSFLQQLKEREGNDTNSDPM